MRSLRNVALNLFTSVGMTLIQLGIGIILARTLGPAGRGEVQIVFMWPFILSWACGLSFGQANAYYGAAHKELRPALFTNSVWTAFILGIPCAAISVAVLPHFVHLTDANRLLFIIGICRLPDAMLSDYLGWLIYSSSRYGKFSIFRIAPQAVTAAAVFVLWAVHRLDVPTTILATWAGTIVSFIFAIYAFTRDQRMPLLPDWKLIRKSLHYSIRVHFGTLASAANCRLDQLLMSAMVSAKALGLYVFAITFAEMLNQGATAISLVLFPKVAGEKDPIKQAEHAATSVRWTLIIGVLGGSALYVLAPIVIPLVWGAQFEASVSAVHWLLPGIVALGVCNILSASLRASGKPELTSIAEVASLAVMVTLLLTLLPRLGIVGASIASTFGYFINLCVLMFYFRREFGMATIASMRPCRNDIVYARKALVHLRRRKVAIASEGAPS